MVKHKPATESSPTYVLKELRTQDDEQARARFSREVANLKGLDDVGIPKVVESNASAFQGSEDLFLVLEHINGQTLKQRIEDSSVSLEEALQMTLELLRVLEYCHGVPVIHRDIKPGNIVLRDNDIGRPVVVDFGLSFNLESDDELTMSGESVGNSCLRLPEQSQSSTSKRKMESDVTQVCGLLVYAVTGHCPGELHDADEGLKPHRRAKFMEAVQAGGDAKFRRLCEVLDKAFNHRLEERWRSATECRDAIESALGISESVTALDTRARELGARFAAAETGLARRNPHKISEELLPMTEQAVAGVRKYVEKQLEIDVQKGIDEHRMVMRHFIHIRPLIVGLSSLSVVLSAQAIQGKVHVKCQVGNGTEQALAVYLAENPAPVEQMKLDLQALLMESLESLLPPDL